MNNRVWCSCEWLDGSCGRLDPAGETGFCSYTIMINWWDRNADHGHTARVKHDA